MKNKYIEEAINQANINADENFINGGPFGAVIVKDDKIIAKGRNQVLKANDPTEHAEINAIRNACKKLGTHDLTGCTLYTSCQPCPMCLSAIIWSNIKLVYYANTKEDADDIGFRDDIIYDFIKSNNSKLDILEMKQIKDTNAIDTFKRFKNCSDKKIY